MNTVYHGAGALLNQVANDKYASHPIATPFLTRLIDPVRHAKVIKEVRQARPVAKSVADLLRRG